MKRRIYKILIGLLIFVIGAIGIAVLMFWLMVRGSHNTTHLTEKTNAKVVKYVEAKTTAEGGESGFKITYTYKKNGKEYYATQFSLTDKMTKDTKIFACLDPKDSSKSTMRFDAEEPCGAKKYDSINNGKLIYNK
ncbi:hypothetical protein B5723_12555 [Mammaliicoccus sciuri]|uniref:hypothetical protein n=1 Tax=Mammaliicoccus sciuri TaxID=1296 RepID=UPI000A068247|nr:hypothetical protein [Mammaliicoccus sciuri]ORI01184.1 hypothetical protein B5723_12555 [Mammaliicoccus sciuri]